jgi:hypothetical protein
MEGGSYRISAASLRNRGLVTISGRRASWSAQITERGREYLEKVDGPEPPVPRQANLSVTQQLVDDVIAAGGSLQVPRKRPADREGVDYRKRAQLAERYGKVPPGQRLDVAEVGDALEIRLRKAPGSGGRAELVEVVVPKRIGRYHPAAKRFHEEKDAHEVSRAHLRRAVQIVHVIAKEAGRRGWTTKAGPLPDDELKPRSPKKGQIWIEAGGHDFGLRVCEQGVRTRGPWEKGGRALSG